MDPSAVVAVNEVVISSSNNENGGANNNDIIDKRQIVIKKEEVDPNLIIMNSSDVYQCPQCNDVYHSETSLNNHLLTDHHVIITKTASTPVMKSSSRCPFCKNTVRDLPEHLLNVHPDKLVQAPSANPEPPIPIFLPRQPVPPSQLSPIDATPTGVSKKFPPLNIDKVKSEEVNLLLTVGSAPTSRPSSPIRHYRGGNNPNNESFPMNLSVRRISPGNPGNLAFHHRNSRSAPVSGDDSGNDNNNDSANNRKRRKQTHVPDQNKDERYWARRLKNNEAAKRSRDMRIKRERVVFEENSKLERTNNELLNDIENLRMENKELHLKMGLIMDENARLKALLSKTNNSDSNTNNVNVITVTTSTTNGNGIRQLKDAAKLAVNNNKNS